MKPTLITAFWLWLSACPSAGLLAAVLGGNVSLTSEIVAVAMAPAILSLALMARVAEWRVSVAVVAGWLGAALGLTAMTGGAGSPLAASLLVGPILARTIRMRRAGEAAAAAVFCYLLSSWLAHWWERSGVSPLPQFLTVLSLTLAGRLIAISDGASAPEQNSAREALLSQRIAEVSHELRTPLGHILGFAEILEREMFGPIGERNVEYAGLIRRSGSHLLELVNDLLDISKIEAGRYQIEREDFDARSVVEEVVRLSADAARRKQIELKSETLGTPLVAHADQRALRRMLINTIGNALKFTPDGGRVVVVARAEGDKLVLDTIDTGPGIPAAERDRLGREYERGESGALAEGTGLGLALVRALARLHSGSLSFHDAPGGGALVRIELPVLKI